MRALRTLRSTSLRRPLQVLGRAGRLAMGLGDVVGYGYRRYVLGYEPVDVDWSLLTDKPRRFETFELLLNLEQAPDPDNRVTLGPGRDALGLPRSHVIWRWREDDQRSLDQARRILARDLERSGVGRIVPIAGTTLDPNAHHHLGGTRMHRDPRQGVVDENCRVHATANLFVAGSSVFPTGGFANPTLTIVALALRLADHLERALGTSA
jgi:choline dehydrogenase-like flavoprotein